ncbi:hypothetical protein MRX96_014070 [Rhipicephalus microplus]
MPSTETTWPTVRFHDYAIFFCLTALSMGIGLYLSLRKRGRASTRDEAFLGSRTLHAIPLALSMVASSVTAVGMIGFVAYYYQYGFHTLWCIPTFVPGGLLVSYLILPVLYELRVTSIFERSYTTRLEKSHKSIRNTPLAACTVLIGVAGTTYTALGGLCSVVWADCVQAIIMTASPFTIIGKILYDSAHGTTPPRPLGDWNYSANILRTELDFTTDETVWAASIGAFPVQLMRLGLDQMITQRFLAARSLTQARTVALGGVSLLSFCYVLHALTGLAMVYWYRDCDPVLSGSIPRYDQIVPYYINRSASSIDGFRGLFLAGIVSASISTVSSVVNSHAAVLYVDIVSPYIRISEKKSGVVNGCPCGTVMVLLGLLISYIGSAARFFIALNSAAAGPFAGIVILAFFFPWANAKGTAVAALVVFVLQIWQTTGRFFSRITPARMTYSVDRCLGNYTLHEEAPPQSTEHVDALLLYHLSPYWCCFLTMCITVLLGLSFSLLCASTSDDIRVAARLASPPVFKLWRRVGLLRHVVKTESHKARETVGKNSFHEIQPLKVKEDNLASQPGKDGDIDIGV